MNIDELTSFVLLSGGEVFEDRIERHDEHKLAAPPLSSTDLLGYYYKLSLVSGDKRYSANILYYRDNERLCPVSCRLRIGSSLGTQLIPHASYADTVNLLTNKNES